MVGVQNLLPGKGVHIDLTAGDFVRQVLVEAYIKTTGEGEALVDELIAAGWTAETDKFGKKAYRSEALPDGGEIRVTVVLRPDGSVKLDIRTWYVPK
jgi:hypothetical protein